MEPSAAKLEGYLARANPPYTEIGLMLFSHGVDSVGLAPIERWRGILRRVPRGAFVGVDARAYPHDFATFARYNPALRRQPGPRFPLPAPLTLDALDAFLDVSGPQSVRWIDANCPAHPAARPA